MPNPRPELTTTKTSGGVPARLAAFIALAALGVVVYIGISGRPPAPPVQPLPTLGPAAAVASATPEPTAIPSPTMSPTDEPTPTLPVPTITPWAPAAELYSITTTAGDQRIRNILVTTENGTLEGALGTEKQPRGKAKLELSTMTVEEGINSFQRLGKWTVNTAGLKVGEGPDVLLDVHVEGRPKQLSSPLLVQSGYQLTVHGMRSARTLTLFFYLQPNPIERPLGEDGLIGKLFAGPSSDGSAP